MIDEELQEMIDEANRDGKITSIDSNIMVT
jgi:hypothetical protein